MSDEKLRPDRFEKAAPKDGVDAWIYSSFEKDNWRARVPGDQVRAEHPGTALQVGPDIYEILKVEETGVEGSLVRYGLKKWDAQYAIRKIIPYTPETRAQAEAAHLEQESISSLQRRLWWLFPLAGLAPDPLQRRWEMKTGVNMVLVSFASAFVMFGVYVGLAQGAYGVGSTAAIWAPVMYLGAESFLRILWILFSGKPRGSLVLTLPYLVYEAVFRPERKAQKEEWIKFSLEADELVRRGGEHLAVRSMLFDEWLAGPDPLRIEGAVWRPLNWREEGRGLQRRFVYEFARMEPEPGRKYLEVTRPRSPDRQKAVEDYTRLRERAHIFALVWGLYPAREQLRLEARFHFPAAYWTAVTAGFVLAAAAFQAWVLVIIAAPRAALFMPGYWTAESLYRLYRSRSQGQPAGSLMGVVLGAVLRAPR